jgi:hypothetical protein
MLGVILSSHDTWKNYVFKEMAQRLTEFSVGGNSIEIKICSHGSNFDANPAMLRPVLEPKIRPGDVCRRRRAFVCQQPRLQRGHSPNEHLEFR